MQSNRKGFILFEYAFGIVISIIITFSAYNYYESYVNNDRLLTEMNNEIDSIQKTFGVIQKNIFEHASFMNHKGDILYFSSIDGASEKKYSIFLEECNFETKRFVLVQGDKNTFISGCMLIKSVTYQPIDVNLANKLLRLKINTKNSTYFTTLFTE